MRRSGRIAAMAAALCAMALGPPTSKAAPEPPSTATDSVTVRYWVAGCSVAEDLWKYRKSSTITCDARGRTLASTNGAMAWPDYLTATDIDTLIVEGEGLAPLRFALEWSADESFSPERAVRQEIDPSGDGQVRFRLKGAPEWRGLIRRFRLTWTGEPPPGSRIVAAWGRRYAVEPKPAG